MKITVQIYVWMYISMHISMPHVHYTYRCIHIICIIAFTQTVIRFIATMYIIIKTSYKCLMYP